MSPTVLSRNMPNIYDTVTKHIVEAIEAGAGRCVMPWHSGIAPITLPRNALTEMPYRGINVLTLWAQASVKSYPSGYWASYEQWRKLGAQVRKGERASPIVFYKRLENGEEQPDASDGINAPRFVLRHSHLFNSAQIDGWDVPAPPTWSKVEMNAQVAAFIGSTKANIRHGAPLACYRPNGDYIEMPSPELFIGTPTSSPTESYHAVLLHELTHWTGAEHRLARTSGKRFGDREYAFEELVAELGAAFLCSAFRMVNEPRPDHAAYIGSWLEILSRDNRAILAAAGLAQKAVEYLSGLAPPPAGVNHFK